MKTNDLVLCIFATIFPPGELWLPRSRYFVLAAAGEGWHLQNMSGAASYDIAADWHDVEIVQIYTISRLRQNGTIIWFCCHADFAG